MLLHRGTFFIENGKRKAERGKRKAKQYSCPASKRDGKAVP